MYITYIEKFWNVLFVGVEIFFISHILFKLLTTQHIIMHTKFSQLYYVLLLLLSLHDVGITDMR